jgi:hypothetical protein
MRAAGGAAAAPPGFWAVAGTHLGGAAGCTRCASRTAPGAAPGRRRRQRNAVAPACRPAAKAPGGERVTGTARVRDRGVAAAPRRGPPGAPRNPAGRRRRARGGRATGGCCRRRAKADALGPSSRGGAGARATASTHVGGGAARGARCRERAQCGHDTALPAERALAQRVPTESRAEAQYGHRRGRAARGTTAGGERRTPCRAGIHWRGQAGGRWWQRERRAGGAS